MTAYAEWVLGTSRGASGPGIITALEPETRALLVRNPWNTEFGGRVAFLDLGGRQTAWTADRTEFLGRNGAPDRPAGLDRGHRLAGTAGAGMDPCTALQTSFELASGALTQVLVLLGEADGATAAARPRPTLGRTADHRAAPARRGELLGRYPRHRPGPDPRPLDGHHAQPLAALPDAGLPSLGKRPAFYQSGGAYGFRDQLQDVMALVDARGASSPGHTSCARRHISSSRGTSSTGGIRRRVGASAHGSRTICLWLPYAVARYLEATGDTAVLDETVPFLEGPVLRPDQDGRLLPAGTFSGYGVAVRALCARLSTVASRSARTACR